MCELKTVKVDNKQEEKSIFNCKKCKFNTNIQERLHIHDTNVHETIAYRCNKCTFSVPNEKVLIFHKRIMHPIT